MKMVRMLSRTILVVASMVLVTVRPEKLKKAILTISSMQSAKSVQSDGMRRSSPQIVWSLARSPLMQVDAMGCSTWALVGQ